MTKEELKKEFEKYLKDSSDYYDPREPLTERKLLQMWLDCAEPREKRIAELEAQIEKMSEILLDLLWFEEHLDPYTYDCNDAQKGELLKPFDNARLFLEKYKCKKCKGEGIIKVGYNGWTTNPCPACEGKGYILRR